MSHLIPIKRALISVSDKTGLADFARALVQEFHVELISTGGTARHLREQGLAVKDVAEVTGFPEMMDGRVKTLHPRIHGGLLALRDQPEHIEAMKQHGIEPIDLVCINLYPFEATVSKPGPVRSAASTRRTPRAASWPHSPAAASSRFPARTSATVMLSSQRHSPL